MSTTTRRLLAATTVTVGVLALSGQPGSSAEGPPETTTTFGPGLRTEVELSQADTGAASDSFEAAKTICFTKVLPKALMFNTLQKLTYPACPVAVQVCAVEALANAHAAVVHIYDHYFDCAD